MQTRRDRRSRICAAEGTHVMCVRLFRQAGVCADRRGWCVQPARGCALHVCVSVCLPAARRACAASGSLRLLVLMGKL
eukprot:1601699-Prymnesium_polylepis.1